MRNPSIIGTTVLSISLLLQSSVSVGQDNPGTSITKTGSASRNVARPQASSESLELTDEELSEKDRAMVETAMKFSEECARVLEKWVDSKEISEEKLFSFLYFPIPNTKPAKFTTDYDQLSDRDIQPILEKYLKVQPDIVYATMSDRNGYTPTHNLKYSKELTGNWANDLGSNRTKRIFADRTGLASARNQKPYLFQMYSRDTGQLLTDLSVPIYVKGQHWGCVRIGYVRTN